MAFSLFDSRGTALEHQQFTWRDMVRKPLSKLDDDAFTRVRVILMNGIETEALRFSHSAARCNSLLRQPLALVRRAEQHQATTVNWLLPPDLSPLETTIAYEQAALELGASVARRESDPCLAQVYRFGMLEDFDHLYRFAALLDRLEGKDPNNILQSSTDILPARPTWEQHRHPSDDLRNSYDHSMAALPSKLHALTILAVEQQAHTYYMNVGPQFADPVARQLYAEIASSEEQHVTQCESLLDPTESWLEQWMLHEANECYAYYSCIESETNHEVKALWERFLDYELGHFHVAAEAFARYDRRDPAEVITGAFDAPLPIRGQRDFYRQALAREAGLRALGTQLVARDQESQDTIDYRTRINSDGSPSLAISAGYLWSPGTELARRGPDGGIGRAPGGAGAPLNLGGVVSP